MSGHGFGFLYYGIVCPHVPMSRMENCGKPKSKGMVITEQSFYTLYFPLFSFFSLCVCISRCQCWNGQSKLQANSGQKPMPITLVICFCIKMFQWIKVKRKLSFLFLKNEALCRWKIIEFVVEHKKKVSKFIVWIHRLWFSTQYKWMAEFFCFLSFSWKRIFRMFQSQLKALNICWWQNYDAISISSSHLS